MGHLKVTKQPRKRRLMQAVCMWRNQKKKNALNIDPPFQLFFFFFNSQKLTYFGLVNSLSNPPIYFEGFAVYVAKLDSCLLDKHDMADTISATTESGNFPQLIIVRFQYSIRSKILLKSSSWQESKRSKVSCTIAHANSAAMFAAKPDGRKSRKSPGKVRHSRHHKSLSCHDQWSLKRVRKLNFRQEV